jgi:hypothetical protein
MTMLMRKEELRARAQKSGPEAQCPRSRRPILSAQTW